MPTFRHGKVTYFAIQDSGGVERNISDALRSVSFPRTVDTAETSAFGTSAKTYVIGLYGSTLSFEGMFDATYEGYLNGIVGMEAARTFTYGPEGNTATRIKYTGSLYLTSLQVNGSIGDMVAMNIDCQLTGAVTRTTF